MSMNSLSASYKKEKETKPVIIATRKLHFFEDACVNEMCKIKKPKEVSNYFFFKVCC